MFWLLFVCFIGFDSVLYNRFIFIWITKNTYYDSLSASIFINNNHINRDSSNRINGLSTFFSFFNKCLCQEIIIDVLYTSYTLYASYGSILMVFSSAATLFSANFNIIYQNTHCRCDLISIFDDTSVFSIVFDTMIIIVTRIIQFGNV